MDLLANTSTSFQHASSWIALKQQYGWQSFPLMLDQLVSETCNAQDTKYYLSLRRRELVTNYHVVRHRTLVVFGVFAYIPDFLCKNFAEFDGFSKEEWIRFFNFSGLLANKVWNLVHTTISCSILRLECAWVHCQNEIVDASRSRFSEHRKHVSIRPSRYVQAPSTVYITLSDSEKNLLAQMKQKTRYNIRLSQKHGVKVHRHCLSDTLTNCHTRDSGRGQNTKHEMSEESTRVFNQFYTLLCTTAKRDGFAIHSKQYYQDQIVQCSIDPSTQLYLLLAYQSSDPLPIAGAVILHHIQIPNESHGIATYLYGASDYRYRNVMAPYLIQWHAIVHAKSCLCSIYDLYGITRENSRISGLNRFKTGFATTQAQRLFCIDLCASKPLASLRRSLFGFVEEMRLRYVSWNATIRSRYSH